LLGKGLTLSDHVGHCRETHRQPDFDDAPRARFSTTDSDRLSRTVAPVRDDEMPPELRGVSPDPVREPSTPLWVRVVALLLIVALVGYFVISAF
jgi:hypothetical protein